MSREKSAKIIRISFADLEKPDLLVHIQKLQLALEQERESARRKKSVDQDPPVSPDTKQVCQKREFSDIWHK